MAPYFACCCYYDWVTIASGSHPLQTHSYIKRSRVYFFYNLKLCVWLVHGEKRLGNLTASRRRYYRVQGREREHTERGILLFRTLLVIAETRQTSGRRFGSVQLSFLSVTAPSVKDVHRHCIVDAVGFHDSTEYYYAATAPRNPNPLCKGRSRRKKRRRKKIPQKITPKDNVSQV